MSQTRFESSEDENESEEGQYEGDQHYDEVPGEYDGDYEQNEEEYWYIQSPRNSKGRSSRSSNPASVASVDRRRVRKSLKRNIVGGHGYSISEDNPLNLYNQDLVDLLPEDIYHELLDFWHDIDNEYYPMNEKAFDRINLTHKKLMDFPSNFLQEFQRQLDGPDNRANVADLFKTNFNRVPLGMRASEQVKSALFQRVNEFMVNLEAVTEEKYASTKRNAYKILSKGGLTRESEKLARMFAALLHAETNRFSDTVKFINEHYYNTIAVDHGMPNKVRWKEILDIGLIKKKFLCEHFRNQCFQREQLQSDGGGESWKYSEYGLGTAGTSSSDTDVCGGGLRGQDFARICEDEDDDSTPIDEDTSDNSLFKRYDEDGENEGMHREMSGEMKLSLECDNEEYLGEDGWDAYAARQNVAPPSTGVVEIPELTEDQETSEQEYNFQVPASPQSRPPSTVAESSKNQSNQTANTVEGKITGKSIGSQSKSKKSKTDNTPSKNSKSKASIKKTSLEGKAIKKKKESKSEQKLKNDDGEDTKFDEEETEGNVERSNFDYPKEYDEELEMEPEKAIVENHEYYENEYAGEFWEGEGYDMALYKDSRGTNRESSVKFEDKPPYVREFFWDSDPSKQDDASKIGNGKEPECADEGYFDDEEVFDDEDVFYNRDEFFEQEEDSLLKSGKSKSHFRSEEPQALHFAIFGQENDVYSKNMSLLNKLLLRWNGRGAAGRDGSNVNEVADRPTEQVKCEEDEREASSRSSRKDNMQNVNFTNKSFSDNMKSFSKPTPASNVNYNVPLYEGQIKSSGINDGLLKLHPLVVTERAGTVNNERTHSNVKMMQQKRPLLESFINLHDEIWSGFEIAFRSARSNIEKLMTSLKTVVSKAYPIEDPRDPCEPEIRLEELIAMGEEIKEKYRFSAKTQSLRISKAHKHVHLKDIYDGEIPGEGQYYSAAEDEDNDEEGNPDAASPKASFIELVPLQTRNTSSGDNETLELAQHPEQSSQKKKTSGSSGAGSKQSSKKERHHDNISHDGSMKKKSVLVPDSASGSKHPDKTSHGHEVVEVSEGITEEEKEHHDKKSSLEASSNVTEAERESSLNDINSQPRDHRESIERKSIYLERTPADTDIRLPESPVAQPSPEEKKILKRAKLALLITKLQNWERALSLEAERLARQLALIESHAQHEFRMLKELPYNVWESSKSESSDVYFDDLKRFNHKMFGWDAEIGDMFKSAVQDGSPLHGKFYVDRRELMLLLKGNEPPIPLKYYTDEFMELTGRVTRGNNLANVDYAEMEE